MSLLIAILARWGLPEPLQRVVAWAITLTAVFALLWGAKTIYDHAVIDRYQNKVDAQAAKGREIAAEERTADAAKDTANEKELHHAIDTAPKGGEISPAARALACERLRKLGRIPPACRPESSNGSEAHPQR